jgi:hypothetical protein
MTTKLTTITTKQIFEKDQILTLAKVKELKGKLIATTHPVYNMNQATVTILKVGDIVPQETFWTNQDPEFLKKRKDEYGEVFELTTFDGKGTAIRCHRKENGDIFTCSDIDRQVYYIELPSTVTIRSNAGDYAEKIYEVVGFSHMHHQSHEPEEIPVYLLKDKEGNVAEWTENTFTWNF